MLQLASKGLVRRITYLNAPTLCTQPQGSWEQSRRDRSCLYQALQSLGIGGRDSPHLDLLGGRIPCTGHGRLVH